MIIIANEIEEWRNIKLRGGQYKVNNYGDVKGARGLLKQRVDVDGYKVITAGSNNNRSVVRIHRVVALAFVPNPDKLATVNHIDFDRVNNRVENLEWLSHADNVKHSIDNGRYDDIRKGELNGRAKLTEEDVIKIRQLYENGKQIYLIAEEYERGWSTIYNAVTRKTWKHVE